MQQTRIQHALYQSRPVRAADAGRQALTVSIDCDDITLTRRCFVLVDRYFGNAD
jgi:hypothetical protein